MKHITTSSLYYLSDSDLVFVLEAARIALHNKQSFDLICSETDTCEEEADRILDRLEKEMQFQTA